MPIQRPDLLFVAAYTTVLFCGFFTLVFVQRLSQLPRLFMEPKLVAIGEILRAQEALAKSAFSTTDLATLKASATAEMKSHAAANHALLEKYIFPYLYALAALTLVLLFFVPQNVKARFGAAFFLIPLLPIAVEGLLVRTISRWQVMGEAEFVDTVLKGALGGGATTSAPQA